MASDYKYKRVLLKLSGEALMGEAGYGIDPKAVSYTHLDVYKRQGLPNGFGEPKPKEL